MENLQSEIGKQMARYGICAFIFIACGLLSIAFVILGSYDSVTRPYDAVSSILSVNPDLLEPVQPKPEEWPLTVARAAYYPQGTRSNRYTVEITPVRGTMLLRLDVIGRSPERTTAFGKWLTDAFDRDFSSSLASRSIPSQKSKSGSLIEQVSDAAVPLRLHPGTLLLSLLSPLLLLASGFLLFRVSKANISGA